MVDFTPSSAIPCLCEILVVNYTEKGLKDRNYVNASRSRSVGDDVGSVADTMNSIQGQVALITGGSRGIGKVLAAALAQAGVRVALTARDAQRLQQVQEAITTDGGTAYGIAADLADPSSPPRLVAQTVAHFGRLDILVNNAGIVLNRSLVETSAAEWDELMAINVRAPFLLCQAAIPALKAAGGGTIIQMVSVVGVKGYLNQAAYTASKHALLGMSKVLAQEVQADHIRVHTILPGGVATDMIGSVRPDLDPADLMQPAEIAEIVLFLLTHRGNAMIDDIHVRRANSAPWF